MRAACIASMLAAQFMFLPPAQAEAPLSAVILDMGPVEPTPAPTARPARRMRLITSLTLQNKPEANSIISFEATDMARFGKKDFRVIATDVYNLMDDKKENRELRLRILAKIRDIERDLLELAEKSGGPRERSPLSNPVAPTR